MEQNEKINAIYDHIVGTLDKKGMNDRLEEVEEHTKKKNIHSSEKLMTQVKFQWWVIGGIVAGIGTLVFFIIRGSLPVA